MRDQEAKIIAVASGFQEAEGEIRRVTDAERELAESILKSGDASAEASNAARSVLATHANQQKAVNAAVGDFAATVRQIAPGLGPWIDGMTRAFKVAGDLGNVALPSLNQILDKGADFARKHADALKLIGAGGAVAAGIAAIAGSLRVMNEEAQRTIERMKELQRLSAEIEKQRSERAQSFEEAGATRREGPPDTEEVKRLTAQAERLGVAAPGSSEDQRSRAVLLGGADATIEELVKIRALLEVQPDVDVDRLLSLQPDRRADVLTALIERNAEAIGTVLAREREQLKETLLAAQRETASGGTLSNLQAAIESSGLGAGQDAARLAAIVNALQQAQGTKIGLDDAMARGGGGLIGTLSSYPEFLGDLAFGGGFGRWRSGASRELTERGIDPGSVTNDEITIGLQLLEWLRKLVDSNERLASEIRQRQGGGDVHHHNGRYFGPDAASKRRRTNNGENRRENSGRG